MEESGEQYRSEPENLTRSGSSFNRFSGYFLSSCNSKSRYSATEEMRFDQSVRG